MYGIPPCTHVGEQSRVIPGPLRGVVSRGSTLALRAMAGNASNLQARESAWSYFTGQQSGTPGGGRQWQAASRDMNRRLVGVCCCTGTGQRRSLAPTARPRAKTHVVPPNDVVPRYKIKKYNLGISGISSSNNPSRICTTSPMVGRSNSSFWTHQQATSQTLLTSSKSKPIVWDRKKTQKKESYYY